MPRRAAADYVKPVISTFPSRLRPPSSLSPGARKKFCTIVATESAGHFRESDLPLLEEYCEAGAWARRAATELQSETAASRWLAIWEKANRILVSHSARLRLCPQSRQPNNPTRPKKMSYYEREAAGLGEDDDAV